MEKRDDEMPHAGAGGAALLSDFSVRLLQRGLESNVDLVGRGADSACALGQCLQHVGNQNAIMLRARWPVRLSAAQRIDRDPADGLR